MVLDTGVDEIFIWIGKGASPEEKKLSNSMADVSIVIQISCINGFVVHSFQINLQIFLQEYIKNNHQRSGGNAVTISIVVKQGDEPDSFKTLFPGWNDDHWKVHDAQGYSVLSLS